MKIGQLTYVLTTMKKASRVYNWLHLIGCLLFLMLGIGFGSVISDDAGRAVLAPANEVVIFGLSLAGFLAWTMLFPKLTGGDLRKINPRRRTNIGAHG